MFREIVGLLAIFCFVTAPLAEEVVDADTRPCSCSRTVPLSGKYIVEENGDEVRIDFLGDETGQAGDIERTGCARRILVSELEAPSVDALQLNHKAGIALDCVGTKYWARLPLKEANIGYADIELYAGDSPMGIGVSDKITMTTTPHIRALLIPPKITNLTLLDPSGSAPKCMCENIEGFLNSSLTMRDKGYSAELVSAIEERNKGRQPSEMIQGVELCNREALKAAEGSGDGEEEKKSQNFSPFAFTNPSVMNNERGLCKIAPPQETWRGSCVLKIEIDAAMYHEDIHARACELRKQDHGPKLINLATSEQIQHNCGVTEKVANLIVTTRDNRKKHAKRSNGDWQFDGWLSTNIELLPPSHRPKYRVDAIVGVQNAKTMKASGCRLDMPEMTCEELFSEERQAYTRTLEVFDKWLRRYCPSYQPRPIAAPQN